MSFSSNVKFLPDWLVFDGLKILMTLLKAIQHSSSFEGHSKSMKGPFGYMNFTKTRPLWEDKLGGGGGGGGWLIDNRVWDDNRVWEGGQGLVLLSFVFSCPLSLF